MLDVCSSGKEGEESTFEERSHDAGQQQGLNGSLSGGNPNGGPSALSVHSIPGAAANFIPPQRHLQPIQKLGNGEPQICPLNSKTILEPSFLIILLMMMLRRRWRFWQRILGGRRQGGAGPRLAEQVLVSVVFRIIINLMRIDR